MNLTLGLFALLTGLVTGGLFSYLGVPVPAPPELPGVLGIVGIYLGYKAMNWTNYGIDLVSALGLS